MPSITVNGKSLYYTIAEPAGKATATLLLIHGLGSSSSFYATITPKLKSSCRCISIDTYGSGLSKLSKSHADNSISSIAKDAISILDAVGAQEKVVVVGHSMGGIVASEIAAQYQDRIKAVVLLGPVHPQPKVTEVFEQRIEAVRKNGIETFANTVPTAATGKKSLPVHHAFIRALILGTEPEGYISLCNSIATAQPPKYESVTVPLMIIAGGDDQTAPRAGCEAILEKYGTSPDAKKIEELDGVGHWHCVEAGDAVARLINEFVAELTHREKGEAALTSRT